MRHRGSLAFLVASAVVACAPTQRVRLDVAPEPAVVFVDGAALDSVPDEVELRADRDHKLFFKSEGHRPELVVLRTTATERGPRLEPEAVRVRLRAIAPSGREVVIEPASPAR